MKFYIGVTSMFDKFNQYEMGSVSELVYKNYLLKIVNKILNLKFFKITIF